MSSRFGTARKDGDIHVLRYERRLAYPLAAVWAAITMEDRKRLRGCYAAMSKEPA